MSKHGWTYKKLGEVCDIICGQDYKKVESSNGKYPIYGTGGIMGFANQFRCPAYSVIIGRKGSINNPLYVEEDFWNVDTAFGIVPSKANLISKYFFYFCKSYDFTKHNVAVTIPSLRRIDLLKIPIPVPPIAEQERIVAELDLLSGIIEKKKEQLKAYDQLAQSIFYTMFGDPIDNPKAFPLLTINDVIKFEGGSQPPKTAFEYAPSPDNIRLIQIRDYKTDDYITYIPKSLARRFCDEDDIMIGRYGPPIFQILKGIKGAYNVALMKAVPLKGNKEFIRAFLEQKCLLHYLENFSRRVAGQDGIQMDKLKSYPFPYPPIELQNLFAEKVEAIERQKALVQQSIDETQTMFDFTMDKYFG